MCTAHLRKVDTVAMRRSKQHRYLFVGARLGRRGRRRQRGGAQGRERKQTGRLAAHLSADKLQNVTSTNKDPKRCQLCAK